ncbi:MAG: EscV/YscV/HrcV family type III secretion system export apparatus protein [Rhodopirellula sp.]|nr:EscV/YscV/HrcV family type III secretion system export apparatus protein [Rhodopirellula sp.]
MNKNNWHDLIIPASIVACLLVLLVPLPPFMLDMLMAGNITLAVVILLTTLNIKTSLELSVFPTVLLAATLGRLVLNVASTRLILTGASTQGTEAAGHVIESFGNFVAGNDIIVGIVIFAILVVIQFVVITKGSTRVSEVAARFMLDGMPGRQMAIDADLNSGLLTQQQAQQQRKDLTRQADFFGAMDGASKFVRGDAIAATIITAINIVVGLGYGVIKADMDLANASEVYTKLTIGDGLVSQIPALLVSLATAVLVTRTSQDSKLSNQLISQLFNKPQVLIVTAAFLTVLTFTQLPKTPMLTMAAGCVGLAYILTKSDTRNASKPDATIPPEKISSEAPLSDLLRVDAIEIGLGIRLLPLANRDTEDNILRRIQFIRKTLATDMGIVLPEIRIRDNLQLAGNQYEILIQGNPITSGRLSVNRLLIIDEHPDLDNELPGTVPGEGGVAHQGARWISKNQREKALQLGLQPLTPVEVLAIHLQDTVREHAATLLTLDATDQLVEQLREFSPTAVGELIPKLLGLGQVQQVLRNLLSENISVRPLAEILESLSEIAPRQTHPIKMTEYVRTRLARNISTAVAKKEGLRLLTLRPELEKQISDSIRFTELDFEFSLPHTAQDLLVRELQNHLGQTQTEQGIPVLVVSDYIRPAMARLSRNKLLEISVLSGNEIVPEIEILSHHQLSQDGQRTTTNTSSTASFSFSSAGH